MGTNTVEVAKNIWAISDQVKKQTLMRRFLDKHGELTRNNDFVGFLVTEFGLDKHSKDVGSDGDKEGPENR